MSAGRTFSRPAGQTLQPGLDARGRCAGRAHVDARQRDPPFRTSAAPSRSGASAIGLSPRLAAPPSSSCGTSSALTAVHADLQLRRRRIERHRRFLARGRADSVNALAEPASRRRPRARAMRPPSRAKRGSVPTRSTDRWPDGPDDVGVELEHRRRRAARRAGSRPRRAVARQSLRCRARPAESASARRCRC